MSIDEKAFKAAWQKDWLWPNEADGRKFIESYEAAKVSGHTQDTHSIEHVATDQPVDCREAFEKWCLTNSFHYENGLWKAWKAAWDERAKNGK